MYIRRKVFSLLQDENGEERYFSTTEFEDERLYAEKEDDEKHIGRKVAIGAGATAGTALVGAAGYQGVRHIQKKRANKAYEAARQDVENLEDIIARGKNSTAYKEAVAKENAALENAAKKGVKSNAIERAGKKAEKGVKSGSEYVGETGKKFGNWVKNTWKGGKAREAAQQYKAELEARGLSGAAKKSAEEKLAKLEKKAKNAGVRNKALMIATPIVATGGTIAAAKIAKNRKNRKSDED